MSADLRISGYVPRGWVARKLWAAGVYDPALLEHAEQWAPYDDALGECSRIELVLPLAVLRGDDMARITNVASVWWNRAVDMLVPDTLAPLEALEWCRDDIAVAGGCVKGAVVPDVDVAALQELGHRAIVRAGRKAPGRHRYRLLTAAAHVAQLGVRRVASRFGAAADGEIVGEHLVGALEDAQRVEDLFATRPDVDAWTRAALDFAREALRS